VEQSIEVKPQYGLTDDQVEKMLLDSITYAKDDIKLRALVEARTEGEQLLSMTEKFIAKNASLLTKEELMATAEMMQALQLALTMEDKNLIQQRIEALNEISRPYAERAMDQAVSGALKGKTI
jgi:molecular chaperone HscA